MPVNLSVKNVPDDIAERLRERAERNHRSLQGELRAIIDQAAGPRLTLTPEEVYERARRRRAASGRTREAAPGIVQVIREMREERDAELARRLEGRRRARR